MTVGARRVGGGPRRVYHFTRKLFCAHIAPQRNFNHHSKHKRKTQKGFSSCDVTQGYGMVTTGAIHTQFTTHTHTHSQAQTIDSSIAHAAHQKRHLLAQEYCPSIFASVCDEAFIGIVFVIIVVLVFAKLHSSGIKIFTKVLKRLVINKSIQTNGILWLYHHQRQRKYGWLG